MKKRWMLLCPLILLMALMAACGQPAPPLSPPSAPRAAPPSPRSLSRLPTDGIGAAYGDVLLHPERYPQLYRISEQVPSSNAILLEQSGPAEPYFFALADLDQDGKTELLLGQGGGSYAPCRVLLNILAYDAERDLVYDRDGARAYPLMDSLDFYVGGWFSTQLGVTDLYTEWWRLDGAPDHYWYGWARGGAFYDSSGQQLPFSVYNDLDGSARVSVPWHEAAEHTVASLLSLSRWTRPGNGAY